MIVCLSQRGAAGNVAEGNSVCGVFGCAHSPLKSLVPPVQVVFVFGNMTWKGDMHMITNRGSPRRAWLYPLVAALSVETDGIIKFDASVTPYMTYMTFILLALPCCYFSARCWLQRHLE